MQPPVQIATEKTIRLISEKSANLFVSQIYLPFVLLDHLPGLVRNQGVMASDAEQTQNKKLVPSQRS